MPLDLGDDVLKFLVVVSLWWIIAQRIGVLSGGSAA